MIPSEVRTLEKVTQLAIAAVHAKEQEYFASPRQKLSKNRKPKNTLTTNAYTKRIGTQGPFFAAFAFPLERKSEPLNAAISLPRPARFSCHFCLLKLPSKLEVDLHINASHHLTRVKGNPKRSHKPNATRKHPGASRQEPQTVEFQKTDGSKNWGSSFRDNGQFGSFPAFDAMDDESDP